MVLKYKEGSIWKDYKKTPMRPWRHVEMGGGLLGYLLPSVQLDTYQGHSYCENPHISSHQVSRFFFWDIPSMM